MADFRQQQQAFTDWIRHPETAAAPPDVAPERMQLYRELLFNNVAGFVENAFPMLHRCLPGWRWEWLVSTFFADYRCQSPYFRDIAREFLTFLQSCDWSEHVWAPELAHFEWAEMAADVAEGDWPASRPGDPWTHVPVVSPFAWPLLYRWPVHRFENGISGESQRQTALLVYRKRNHQVAVMEISLPAAALLESVQHNPVPLEAAVEQLARTHALAPEWLAAHVQPWVESWLAEDVICGVKPSP
jgi:hypothetical protein